MTDERKAQAKRPATKTRGKTDAATATRLRQLDEMDRALLRGKKRLVMPEPANITTILRLHPAWRGVLVYDAFAHTVRTTKPPPWDDLDAPAHLIADEWRDADTGRLINWLLRNMKLRVKPEAVERAIAVAADAQRVHPVQEYLQSLKWDRKQRLKLFASKYLGAESTVYTQTVGIKWMVAAVARIMSPGCQVDNTLILETPVQGKRKSSALRALVPNPNWFGETPIEIGDKDSYQALRGKWIYALDELDSTRRAETTKIKSFLTSRIDTYRPSYGRRTIDFPRQVIFCGSTNEESYLPDRTGNRRYWPMRIGRADVDAIEADRDQLWAEAFVLYKKGEKWWDDTDEFRKLCEIEQADREPEDAWLSTIEAYVRRYDDGRGVFTLDVLTKSQLQLERAHITNAHTQRCAAILRDLGYERGPLMREGILLEGGRKAVRRYVIAGHNSRKLQADLFAEKAEIRLRTKREISALPKNSEKNGRS